MTTALKHLSRMSAHSSTAIVQLLQKISFKMLWPKKICKKIHLHESGRFLKQFFDMYRFLRTSNLVYQLFQGYIFDKIVFFVPQCVVVFYAVDQSFYGRQSRLQLRLN